MYSDDAIMYSDGAVAKLQARVIKFNQQFASAAQDTLSRKHKQVGVRRTGLLLVVSPGPEHLPMLNTRSPLEIFVSMYVPVLISI